jgi:glycosyltransferase involved in cell wall biosynthesis
VHLLVIGHVVHKLHDGVYFAYGPYVREMNLWFRHVDAVTVVAPVDHNLPPDPIDLPYMHPSLNLVEVSEFSIQSPAEILRTLGKLPGIWSKTWKEMRKADHIHLRCPGNMGLLGAIVQVFFPHKIKSAKYAGNWDRNSNQPFTYRLQQKILSNTSLSKNMQVLVYGEWPNESQNIRPFFTASYSEFEKEECPPRPLDPDKEIRLLFVGGLNSGKQPVISAQVVARLISEGKNVKLDYFGEGPERETIESFVAENKLKHAITIHGNVPANTVKEAFKKSHFLIFISKSEGWPKVVAEAMFWACLPITTAVSCVPQMLGFGTRGELVNENEEEVCAAIHRYLDQPESYAAKATAAMEWSRQYTLERFDREIQTLLQTT